MNLTPDYSRVATFTKEQWNQLLEEDPSAKGPLLDFLEETGDPKLEHYKLFLNLRSSFGGNKEFGRKDIAFARVTFDLDSVTLEDYRAPGPMGLVRGEKGIGAWVKLGINDEGNFHVIDSSGLWGGKNVYRSMHLDAPDPRYLLWNLNTWWTGTCASVNYQLTNHFTHYFRDIEDWVCRRLRALGGALERLGSGRNHIDYQWKINGRLPREVLSEEQLSDLHWDLEGVTEVPNGSFSTEPDRWGEGFFRLSMNWDYVPVGATDAVYAFPVCV